jgi:hypothetical protein
MPALPAVPGVMKLNMGYTVEGDARAETIHYLRYTGGPPTAAQGVTMCNAFLGAAGAVFAALMGDSVAVSSATLVDLSSSTAMEAVSTGAATTGTRGTALVPPGACAMVSHKILRRYRGGHPRTYFPFGVAGDIATSGLWASAFVTAVNAAYATWANDVLGDGAGCTIQAFTNVSYYAGSTVVISPTTGRAKNVPTRRGTPMLNDITSSAMQTKIGSQRRRNRDA